MLAADHSVHRCRLSCRMNNRINGFSPYRIYRLPGVAYLPLPHSHACLHITKPTSLGRYQSKSTGSVTAEEDAPNPNNNPLPDSPTITLFGIYGFQNYLVS
jgi:hypothetical protein